MAAAVTQPVGSWSAGDAAAYPWLDNYPGLPTYGDAQPSYTQNTSTPVTLSLADAHGGTASCSATVQLQVSSVLHLSLRRPACWNAGFTCSALTRDPSDLCQQCMHGHDNQAIG